MAICSFVVHGDIEKARQAVEANGGEFIGGDYHGAFRGSGVEGEYQLLAGGSGYEVTILKKPWLVSCGYIEKRIKEQFTTGKPWRSVWQKVKGLFE